MKKRIKFKIPLIGILLSFTLCLNACSSANAFTIVSKSLNIDISNAEEISHKDSHGGFHNDGITYIVLKFSDDNLLKQLRENKQWGSFPLDDNTQTLAYGMSNDDTSIGPFLGDIELPEIYNGYYCLIDRHSDKETNILERSSFNFTLALYDIDTKTLHFCKVDT